MQDKPLFWNISYFLDIVNIATAVSWFFAYLTLLIKIRRNNNVIGLSLQTLVILVIAECNHVMITLALSFYFGATLGIDFYLCDCTTAILSVTTLICILKNYSELYERERDNFGANIANYALRLLSISEYKTVSKKCEHEYFNPLAVKYCWLSIYLVNIFISIAIFAFRKSNLPTFISFWESYMDGLSSIALLPQLHMFFNKRPRKVPPILIQFVSFILLARLLMLLYWLLYPLFREVVFPGRVLHILSELMNVLFLINFVFYNIKSRIINQKHASLPM
ncbi:hypothetical protein FG386_001650 [Cryptosporidium ryanae]|uniref:uncharacterized protein n=1 Tax=Cryptosporidium ryanae TaxID=515981 RepID=UPI00351A15B8|nr:hypothetical protein FG386_001650 [Cryptosporidium ryanae]